MDNIGAAVALAGLVLSGVGIALTLFYGRQTCELLRELSRRLSRDKPRLLD